MVVVVLSVTPERLRGVLTRWLLEIAPGMYVGRVPARVRDRLWARILSDVGRGRAVMVVLRRGEQGFDVRVHNHEWEPVDLDGLTLMRRQTPESRELAQRRARRSAAGVARGAESVDQDEEGRRPTWSRARARRAPSAVERRRFHTSGSDEDE